MFLFHFMLIATILLHRDAHACERTYVYPLNHALAFCTHTTYFMTPVAVVCMSNAVLSQNTRRMRQSLCTRVTWAQLLNITAVGSRGLRFHRLLCSYIRRTFLWFSGRCKLLRGSSGTTWCSTCYLCVNIYYLSSLAIRRSFPSGAHNSAVSLDLSDPSNPPLVFFQAVFCFEALKS